MKPHVAALAALLTTVVPATAQNQRSPELQVLDRFAGTWDVEFTYKPVGGELYKQKAVSYRTWSTKGTILRFDDPGLPGEPELQLLLTYDPEAKNYPGVIMSGPARSELTGTWNEQTQAMSFTGTMADGGTMESTHRFVDADNADPKGVFKNAAGEVVAEVGWKQKRRDEKPLGAVPTVDALIASYHEAIGGLQANKKLTTRQREGTISLFGAPDPFKMTVIQKAPNLAYSKVVIPGFGEAVEGHDGKVAWKSNKVEGTVEFQGAELVQKLRDFQFHQYLDLKSEFKKVDGKGRETVNREVYDALLVTREDGSSETLYFDARTHLLGIVKRSDVTIEMSNYQATGGVLYSHTTVVSSPEGTTLMTGNFGSVKHGVKVDESLFARPKE